MIDVYFFVVTNNRTVHHILLPLHRIWDDLSGRRGDPRFCVPQRVIHRREHDQK